VRTAIKAAADETKKPPALQGRRLYFFATKMVVFACVTTKMVA